MLIARAEISMTTGGALRLERKLCDEFFFLCGRVDPIDVVVSGVVDGIFFGRGDDVPELMMLYVDSGWIEYLPWACEC